MAESGVILPADSTGKALRTETQTTAFTTGSGGVVHQQVVSVGDPTTPANLAGVNSTGALLTASADFATTGSITTLNDYVAVASVGRGQVAFQFTGTWVGTVTFQGTVSPTGVSPGSTWVPINATVPTGAPTSTTTTNGVYVVRVGAYTAVRATFTAYTSGAVTVWTNASDAANTVTLAEPAQQAALTKGTQGTTGISTQDLKDAGRQAVVLSASGVASVTTVALMALNQYVAGTVTAGVTTYTVPAGKTFRIQSIQFGSRFTTPSTTVTFASTTFALRFVTTGTTVVGSPILHQDSKLSASNVPTPNSDMAIPDGLELPAGYNIGVTHLASAATLSEDVAIVGFLY